MSTTHFAVSFEIRSPERGTALNDYLFQLRPLIEHHPVYISIANHQPDEKYAILKEGNLVKIVSERYPANVYFAIALRGYFGVEVVPHLICNELDPVDIEDCLIGFSYIGIKKLMALRGDRKGEIKIYNNRYSHADELVKHISAFNRQNGTRFEIGIAGYPETHRDAISANQDLYYLKNKVDIGADFITTQMFFNSRHFVAYVNRCREKQISVPIIPALKLLSQKASLVQYKTRFNVTIPAKLAASISNMEDQRSQYLIGVQWLYRQCVELIDAGFLHLHFYVFSNEDIKGVDEVSNLLKN